MNDFDAEKFKSEVNKLGLNAVEERETPEFRIAAEKLKLYFIKFYSLYLYDVFELEIGTANDRKQGKVDSSFDFAYNNYERIIESKIRNYNPENANSSELPFFSYLIKDFVISGKKQYEKDKMITRNAGMNPGIDDHEIALLNRLLRLYNNLGNDKKSFYQIAAETFDITEGEIAALWSKRGTALSVGLSGENGRNSSEEAKTMPDIIDRKTALLKKMFCLYEAMDNGKSHFYTDASVIFDKPEKEVKKVWEKYTANLPVSLNETVGSDPDGELLLDTVDSGVRIEKQLEESDYIREHLLLLNKIYHDSFMEKHKLAFPPCFTNDLIIGWVKEHQKTNVNFEKTVEENWDLINLPHKRLYYNGADYLCISEWIYDWFEQTRRQITGKEIAGRINMSASGFTKVCNQAKEIIENYVRS